MDIDQLNPEQSRAAAHVDGPMLVVSGPGTGKTTALAARYRELLRRGVEPERILAITFTRKAAQHMLARITREVGVDAKRTAIGTFHSIALFVIKNWPQAFGELPTRRILGDSEPELIVLKLAGELDVPSDGLADAIERYKDQLITPEQAIADARKAQGVARHGAEMRARVYARYQKELAARNAIDFGDIVMAVVRAMEQDKRLLATLRERYTHVMIDEFQDINKAQYRLVQLLAGKGGNVWAIGDPDQSIYGFRGSDIRYILNFDRLFPGRRRIELVQNYRSCQGILDVATGLISNNRLRFGAKELRAYRSDPAALRLHEARDSMHEAEWVADEIERLAGEGVPYDEMAVLVRVAHHGTWIEQALSRRGIPFELLGVTNFWTLTEVKRALRAIQEVTGAQVAPDSESTPRWLLEKVGEPSGNFVKDARSVCHAVARSPSKVITGQRREAWQAAMNVLAEEIKVLGSPKAFGDFVKARGAVGQRGDQKGVSLGTIHAAKGLEWSAVFLAACEEGVLPHAKNDDIEEERRLAFVAITRARNFVGVSYALSRGRQEAAPSPFVGEMLRSAGPGMFKRSSD